MNCIQFITSIMGLEYVYNPLLAEELYKYKAVIWSDIISRKKNVPKGSDESSWMFASYCADNGLSTREAGYLMDILCDKAKWNDIRAEFDEEWVEYGFLSIEDGGRGVEY